MGEGWGGMRGYEGRWERNEGGMGRDEREMWEEWKRDGEG